jgi:hypothetical protein
MFEGPAGPRLFELRPGGAGPVASPDLVGPSRSAPRRLPSVMLVPGVHEGYKWFPGRPGECDGPEACERARPHDPRVRAGPGGSGDRGTNLPGWSPSAAHETVLATIRERCPEAGVAMAAPLTAALDLLPTRFQRLTVTERQVDDLLDRVVEGLVAWPLANLEPWARRRLPDGPPSKCSPAW